MSANRPLSARLRIRGGGSGASSSYDLERGSADVDMAAQGHAGLKRARVGCCAARTAARQGKGAVERAHSGSDPRRESQQLPASHCGQQEGAEGEERASCAVCIALLRVCTGSLLLIQSGPIGCHARCETLALTHQIALAGLLWHREAGGTSENTLDRVETSYYMQVRAMGGEGDLEGSFKCNQSN